MARSKIRCAERRNGSGASANHRPLKACRSPGEAEKGKSENLYVVRYPIKPGETNVDVGYRCR